MELTGANTEMRKYRNFLLLVEDSERLDLGTSSELQSNSSSTDLVEGTGENSGLSWQIDGYEITYDFS
jgi:hypothetical protein